MANSAHIDSILELRRSESYCSRACRRGQAQFKERKACVAPAESTRKCSSLLVKSHEHPAWGPDIIDVRHTASTTSPGSCRRLKERGSYRPRGGVRLLLCGRLGFSGGGLDGPACASGMMIWRFHYIVRRLAGLHSRGIGAIL